jgi:flagellin
MESRSPDPFKEDIMGLRINQNIAAQNAYRNLSVTDGQMAKSLEKLSSGFRINRAADDAAGLVIGEGLRSQVNGLQVATRNADGISVVQTAEGALNEVHAILQRMRDLAVQAANTGSNDANATAAAQTEVSALKSELDRISSSTKFGTMNLLDGTFGAAYSKTGNGINFGSGVTVVNGTNDQFTVDIGAGAVTVDVAAGTYRRRPPPVRPELGAHHRRSPP